MNLVSVDVNQIGSVTGQGAEQGVTTKGPLFVNAGEADTSSFECVLLHLKNGNVGEGEFNGNVGVCRCWGWERGVMSKPREEVLFYHSYESEIKLVGREFSKKISHAIQLAW